MPFKLLILGGALQGIEACYLARETGFETLLVDRRHNPPAAKLAHEFIRLELPRELKRFLEICNGCDLVLPATENHEALESLRQAAGKIDRPVAFDWNAYAVSSDKERSREFFQRTGTPAALPWPHCGFPVLIKPARGSGSRGIRRLESKEALRIFLQEQDDRWLLEEFLEGPSFSLEVIGAESRCACFQITSLDFDADYDCKRVLAGPGTVPAVEAEFEALASGLALSLGLRGIMDIEVIRHQGKLKVLEVDARLPSQTPSAVLHSSGENLLQRLADYWISGRLAPVKIALPTTKAVIYEHFRRRGEMLETAGEHVVAESFDFELFRERFGATVMITNQEKQPLDWVATAIYAARDLQAAWETRAKSLQEMMEAFGLHGYCDSNP